MSHPEDSLGFDIGVSLLQSTTRTDFEIIRNKIINKCKLEDEDVPTFYYMTKGRPKVTHGEQPILDDYKILSRESKINKDNNNKLSETKKKIQKKYYARLSDVSFSSHLLHMLQKCERKFDNDCFWNKNESDEQNNNLLVMISADGAENQSTEEGGANVVSFNLILINKKLLDKGYTSTQSHNILTFEQVCGDEKADLCLSIFY